MKPGNNQQLKWELTRERFFIEARFPPPAHRPEKYIGEILKKITREELPQETPLPQELIDGWPVVVGPQLAQHTTPAHLKTSTLYIHADHPGWLSELKRLPKAHLLKRISTVQQIQEIKDIRFQLDPAIQTQKRPAFSGRPQPPRKEG